MTRIYHNHFYVAKLAERQILNYISNSKLFLGTGILEFGEPPKDKLYSHRIKGITLSFILIKNALCGGYVNFGVFRLYNDPTLEDALNIFIKLVMALQSNYLIVSCKVNFCEVFLDLHLRGILCVIIQSLGPRSQFLTF